MSLVVGLILGVVATALFLRMTRKAKPDSLLGKVRSVISGGGGPDPTGP